jgi:hypothetical protein
LKKVTFLFGAGASFHSLPIVDKMPTKMKDQNEFILYGLLSIVADEVVKISPTEEALEYVADLEWLMKFSEKHASVDTFAKKLALTGKRADLFKLKNVLSAFLLIEQLRNPIDPRYDSFFASLLKSKFDMPKNIRILSWNYDMQFEMAYRYFSDDSNIYNAQATLGVYPKHADNWRAKEGKNNFAIFKINGSSMIYSNDNAKLLKVYSNGDQPQSVDSIFEICSSYCLFKKQPNKFEHGLSFAWEPENANSERNLLSIAKNHTSDTEVLVVIGYSFPFFNREIDRALFSKEQMPNLKKVYIQSPTALDSIERFYSIREDIESMNIIPKISCDQFYLPNEL